MPIIKIIIILLMLLIAWNLFSALYSIIKTKNNPEKAAKSLTWRIGLSLGLFFLIMLAFIFGGLAPNLIFY